MILTTEEPELERKKRGLKRSLKMIAVNTRLGKTAAQRARGWAGGRDAHRCQSSVVWQQGSRDAGPGLPELQTRTAKAWSQQRQALTTSQDLDNWARLHPRDVLSSFLKAQCPDSVSAEHPAPAPALDALGFNFSPLDGSTYPTESFRHRETQALLSAASGCKS